MVLRRCIAFCRTLIWVLELEIMSFSCKFWPKKQYFCCFRLIFCVYRWNLKFCSSRIVEAVKKYFVLNFEVNLIRRFWDWSVLISISRLLYFCITCFFVVCTSITSWIIFFERGCFTYCATSKVTTFCILRGSFMLYGNFVVFAFVLLLFALRFCFVVSC